jgi:predicted enzyme related to lactoylglutathione lyase
MRLLSVLDVDARTTDRSADVVHARERTVDADASVRARGTDEFPRPPPSNPRYDLQETHMNFNSILIGSEDADALAAFYTKLFGEPAMAQGGYTGWQIGSGFVTVGPHSEVTGTNPQPGRLLWNIECDDVRETFDRLKDAGGIVVAEPYTMEGMGENDYIATFADPDGNYFQLMSPMEPPSQG